MPGLLEWPYYIRVQPGHLSASYYYFLIFKNFYFYLFIWLYQVLIGLLTTGPRERNSNPP